MKIRTANVEAVNMTRYDAAKEEETGEERVGVGTCEEEDREGREEDVYEGEDEAS